MTEHVVCRTPTYDFHPSARVLDCKTRKIVALKEGMTYFALSYVWGYNPSIVKNVSSGGQIEHQSQTIEDAIKVVLGLKHRYLWVDRLCIDQNKGSPRNARSGQGLWTKFSKPHEQSLWPLDRTQTQACPEFLVYAVIHNLMLSPKQGRSFQLCRILWAS